MSIDNFYIDNYVMNFISKYRYPSISVGIIFNDEIYLRGYGFKNIKESIAADERTLYCIGSITKSFTALAIMKLYEEGLLDLEDPISEYISGKLPKWLTSSDISIHNLLTHTSGLPALGYAEAFIDGLVGLTREWLPVTEAKDIISFMNEAGEWIVSKPSEYFYYLNEGYVLLGIIISKVSGLSYEEYVKKNILVPLDMKRSFFKREEILNDGGLATPYITDKEGNFIKATFPFGITSDGGLVSNVKDMINYLRMYLNRGSFDGRRILSSENIARMEKGYVKLPYRSSHGVEYYGYGLITNEDFYGYKLIGHSGSILVHTAYMGYIPEKKLGVVLLSNGAGYRLSYLGMSILAYLLGRDPEKLPFIRNEKILDKLTGVYHSYKKTMEVNVEKKGSILYLVFKNKYGGEKIPLFPEKIEYDHATFKTMVDWREYEVEFVIKDGVIKLYYERYKFLKD